MGRSSGDGGVVGPGLNKPPQEEPRGPDGSVIIVRDIVQDPVLDCSIDTLAAEMHLARQCRGSGCKAASQRGKLGIKE